MATFESYERRESKILGVLANYGISSIDECKEICDKYGVDAYNIVQETQPICFENAKWAYTVGCAIALKEAERTGDKSAATAAANIGIGLQSFCIPGSVAENRKVGLGHGNLGKMLLSEETSCWTRVLRGSRRRHQDRPERQQGPQEPPAGHPQRTRKGRRLDHLQDQRLHICRDRIRPLHRGSHRSKARSLFQGTSSGCPLLRR